MNQVQKLFMIDLPYLILFNNQITDLNVKLVLYYHIFRIKNDILN